MVGPSVLRRRSRTLPNDLLSLIDQKLGRFLGTFLVLTLRFNIIRILHFFFVWKLNFTHRIIVFAQLVCKCIRDSRGKIIRPHGTHQIDNGPPLGTFSNLWYRHRDLNGSLRQERTINMLVKKYPLTLRWCLRYPLERFRIAPLPQVAFGGFQNPQLKLPSPRWPLLWELSQITRCNVKPYCMETRIAIVSWSLEKRPCENFKFSSTHPLG